MTDAESASPRRAGVLVITEDVPLRESLRALLRPWPEFHHLATVGTLAEATTILTSARPLDLILLDVTLAAATIAELAAHDCAIVLLKGHTAAPAVLEIPGRPTARALTLPRWVFERVDEPTVAHTRALLLDLCEMSAPPRFATEANVIQGGQTPRNGHEHADLGPVARSKDRRR